MKFIRRKLQRDSDAAPSDRLPPDLSRPGAAKGSEKAKMPPSQTWLWFLGALLANYLLVRLIFPPEAPITVPYTLFKAEVGKGNVAAIYSQGETITGRFKTTVAYASTDKKGATPSAEPQKTAKPARRRRGQNGEQLHDYPAYFRRPRFGKIFDR